MKGKCLAFLFICVGKFRHIFSVYIWYQGSTDRDFSWPVLIFVLVPGPADSGPCILDRYDIS